MMNMAASWICPLIETFPAASEAPRRSPAICAHAGHHKHTRMNADGGKSLANYQALRPDANQFVCAQTAAATIRSVIVPPWGELKTTRNKMSPLSPSVFTSRTFGS